MKFSFFKISIFLLASTLLVVSCSKKIDEAYANPNADVKVPVEQLLPGILASMVGNTAFHGTANDMRFIGRYIQNWQLSSSGDIYDQMGAVQSDNATSTWRTHYYDLGQNLNNMILWASEDKKWDYVGVGQAIFAWSWLTVGDYYGEIILKEAFNTSQLTFKYDTQEDVYNYVRQLCFTSLENLNKTGDGVSSANLAIGDAYFYKGDNAKWKKFVYSVLARSYNHLSNKASYKPDSVIYYAKLGIINNIDNASLKYAVTGNNRSANYNGPFSNNGIGSLRQSVYSVKLLTGGNSALLGVNDPRRWYFLKTNPNGTFVGVEPNRGVTAIANVNDRPNNFYGDVNTATVAPANDNGCTYIFRNYVESQVITASEVQFMKAEAALRIGDNPTAFASYKLGISLNFDMLSTLYSTNIAAANQITDINKLAYLSDPLVVPVTAAELTLSQIMMQKYISLWGHNILETWVDMRRYHYTDTDPKTSKQVYADFAIPTGINLYVNNNNRPVYRVRPRFNSEYVWNLNELIRIGADQLDFHTKETWATQK